MKVQSHLNIAARLSAFSEGQVGFFTRSQAVKSRVEDYELGRAVDYGQLQRLSHGIYRVVGAGVDPYQNLRVAWLRLDPDSSPRARVLRPSIWVSHQSAAHLLGFGVFLADTPEFTTSRRLQPRFDVQLRHRSRGLTRDEWQVIDGFAVTSPIRTFSDLIQVGTDGGHLGQFCIDALSSGTATIEELQGVLGKTANLDTLIAQADKT